MPIFYFHPHNPVPKKLIEMTETKGYLYTNRGELDFKLQGFMADAGYDIWPTFHTVLGSLPGTLVSHLKQVPDFFNPDIQLDAHTLKLCKSSDTPWSWIKVVNGPNMNFIMGFCSTPAINPYNMNAVQMAQKGILSVSHMPVNQ